MPHNSKIITMFAKSITTYPTDAGIRLAFTVQAFFMPGHIVYHIWYPCTPAWSVNAPTAFVGCDRQRERHGYFHFKTLLLCLTMQKLPPLPTTASERPPTKRVLLLSPLPAILSPTLLLTASTCMDSPSAICVLPIRAVISSPDASTSQDVKKQRAQLIMNALSCFWSRNIRNIVDTRLNVINTNENGICYHSLTVILMQWCFPHTFPNIDFSNQSFVLLPVATPSGVIAFLYSDLRTFFGISPYRYYTTVSHLIPRTPWNKKAGKREEVLKRKLFINSVQPSNRPTGENILKCNSLLYSSIYFFFNHIYILQMCCSVGRCWTCCIVYFQPSNSVHPTKTTKKAACWTCWMSSNYILFIVNLYNLIIISNFNDAVGRLDGWKQK